MIPQPPRNYADDILEDPSLMWAETRTFLADHPNTNSTPVIVFSESNSTAVETFIGARDGALTYSLNCPRLWLNNPYDHDYQTMLNVSVLNYVGYNYYLEAHGGIDFLLTHDPVHAARIGFMGMIWSSAYATRVAVDHYIATPDDMILDAVDSVPMMSGFAASYIDALAAERDPNHDIDASFETWEQLEDFLQGPEANMLSEDQKAAAWINAVYMAIPENSKRPYGTFSLKDQFADQAHMLRMFCTEEYQSQMKTLPYFTSTGTELFKKKTKIEELIKPFRVEDSGWKYNEIVDFKNVTSTLLNDIPEESVQKVHSEIALFKRIYGLRT